MAIKIDWPFGPRIRCARCGKTFRYRGTEDDKALDGMPVVCDSCEEEIRQEEAKGCGSPSAADVPSIEILPHTFEETASAPVIHECSGGSGSGASVLADKAADLADKAAEEAIRIAFDDSIGYSQADRYGSNAYDCSSLVIRCCEKVGIPMGNAITTHNMYPEMISAGWQNVTGKINRSTGAGLIKGDVLLNVENHTCMYIGDGLVVNARTDTDGCCGDSHGDEIRIQSYWNYPWNYVLRWPSDGACKPQTRTELDADGEYGPLTAEAVAEFQRQFGLQPDGICGHQTASKIFEQLEGLILRSGDTGWAVTALQAIINYLSEVG